MSNLYEAPRTLDLAPPIDPQQFHRLASPWMRLLAQIIDVILIVIIIVPVSMALVYMSEVEEGQKHAHLIDSSFFEAGMGLLGAIVYLGINWGFLANGQTIGKKITKLQIRMKNGQIAPRMRIITHRFLPVQLVSLFTWGSILTLIDALMIFRERHNTLHDDIAGTKVVQLA